MRRWRTSLSPLLAEQGIVYAVALSGHRRSYLDLLGPMFGLKAVSGRMTWAVFCRLVAAKRLLFATLDDDVFRFVAVAVTRALFGRPTAALFLRAQKCFDNDRWLYRAKRLAFRALRRLPGLSLVTITPFTIVPAYAEVAHAGVCDPQSWDLHDGERLRYIASTPLSQQVREQANGRRVCCALGFQGASKGLVFLYEAFEREVDLSKHVLLVCAGPVAPDFADEAAMFSARGALVIDRLLSDEEFEGLYLESDAIWACYSPVYDQASGVFGRAVQLGVLPLVRSHSQLAAFAERAGIEHRPIPFGDHSALAAALRTLPSRSGTNRHETEDQRSEMVRGWKREFESVVSSCLGP